MFFKNEEEFLDYINRCQKIIISINIYFFKHFMIYDFQNYFYNNIRYICLSNY